METYEIIILCALLFCIAVLHVAVPRTKSALYKVLVTLNVVLHIAALVWLYVMGSKIDLAVTVIMGSVFVYSLSVYFKKDKNEKNAVCDTEIGGKDK